MKTTTYTYLKGVINENLVSMTLNETDFEIIKNNNRLMKNEKKYEYVIISISEPIFDNNYNKYYEIKINVKLPNNELIDNNVVDLVIVGDKVSLIENMIDKIKKGMN